jgi:isoleucyl-tRNA synthetase
VTLDAGTGLVHTAPAHGLDDYVVGMRYNLPIDNPVDDNGRFYDWAEIVAGMSVWDANPVIIQTLERNQRLLKGEKLIHSYPVCWRHKTPIAFAPRHSGSSAWIRITAGGGAPLRQVARRAVADTEFPPASVRAPWTRWSATRLVRSRQRSWGGGTLPGRRIAVICTAHRRAYGAGSDAWKRAASMRGSTQPTRIARR